MVYYSGIYIIGTSEEILHAFAKTIGIPGENFSKVHPYCHGKELANYKIPGKSYLELARAFGAIEVTPLQLMAIIQDWLLQQQKDDAIHNFIINNYYEISGTSNSLKSELKTLMKELKIPIINEIDVIDPEIVEFN
ncbi:hypothetical protein [Abyssalbus ytuae]|uniref:Uncharacterized protein n=1 Tax=Abyssalbus ytuae TaxID=2926907 RepID=A0A9E6ZPN6_9FLAO|nr:hypothetical protein [Abyssalbus ytuae]UOB18604.1 hypothetical protein MQE35_04770 [Abyssalbus ytuae]